MIKTMIVDDDPEDASELVNLLQAYCPQVEVTHTFYSAPAALEALQHHPPQLLFLDVEMPGVNGLQLLEKLQSFSFEVIFVSAHSQYALEAFHINASNYILKPVNLQMLQKAVQRVEHLLHPQPNNRHPMEQMITVVSPRTTKVALATMEGLKMIDVDTIISCTAENNYTDLNLKGHRKLISTRGLKHIEEALSKHSFLRVHNSSLVNLNEVDKYIKGEGGYLVMSDGSTINVSRSHKAALLQRLQSNKL